MHLEQNTIFFRDKPKIFFFDKNSLVIFGVPVYSGRVPAIAIDSLNYFKGNSTPAIVVCVYGNREYDDALLELRNTVETKGFKVISAATFIGEHSIFPIVAAGRPDEKDQKIATEFGWKNVDFLKRHDDLQELQEINVKGNFPYREITNIPLVPKGDKKCNNCGICVKACPVEAITEEQPRKTDKIHCIRCAHCIKICPQNARHFGGFFYKIGQKKFQKAFSKRQEPEIFLG